MKNNLLPLLTLGLFLGCELLGSRPAVGDIVPSATVRDHKGEAHDLRELVSEKPTVLIFYRGGWCPYCMGHLRELAAIESELTDAGYQILAISPDRPGKIAEVSEEGDFEYDLYSDNDMEAAQAFDIAFQVPLELVTKYKNEYAIDLEASSGRTHHLLPHPAVYIVGTDGVIHFTYVNEDYKVRLEPESILETVRGMDEND